MAGFGARLRALQIVVIGLAVLMLGPGASAVEDPARAVTTSHGYAVFGELKYGPDFKHLDYVNPDAAVGGQFRIAMQQSFDSVNIIPLIGTFPPPLMTLEDTLLEVSRDEAASYYCLLCKSISWPGDMSWAEFELRDDVYFQDGQKLTPKDIIFSADLGNRGLTLPSFNRIPQIVDSVEATGPMKVRFNFNQTGNPTLITVIGLMPIVPAHYWEEGDRDPFKPTLEPPVYLSPYKLSQVKAGKLMTWERDANYWGWNHPLRRGRFNFQTLRHDYYRDANMRNEAFKVGLSDLKLVFEGQEMRQEQRLPASRAGNIKWDTLDYDNGAVYNSIWFNARRNFFKDRDVRKALWLAYDFEWVRRAILDGNYGRLDSNFPNSEFRATGIPGGGELALLDEYRDTLPPEIFTQEAQLPVGGTRANMRRNLIEARDLLREAGYRVVDGKLRDPASGEPVELTLLCYSPVLLKHVSLWIENAAKLGITINFRAVDAAQLRHMTRNYDYDILYTRAFFAPLPTPGYGMLQVWSSDAADTPSMFNYAGIKEPAIDAAMNRMVVAQDRQSVLDMMRVTDRIERFGFYSIPLAHMYPSPVGKLPIAYWDKFGRPEIEQTWSFTLNYSLADTWWYDEGRASQLSHGTYR